jgi:type II secretory pathway predicted ATPase ExeA
VNHYVRFIIMIAASTLAMFGLMYLNTYAMDHVFFSQTRAWMALYMGGAMAIVMMLFMLGMYDDRRKNIAILISAAVVFAGSLYLVRSQTTVSDQAWQKAMIPHHSIAILTSTRAQIDDLRVRALADVIVKAQRKEIKEMEWLIRDIAQHGKATTPEQAHARPVPAFEGWLDEK